MSPKLRKIFRIANTYQLFSKATRTGKKTNDTTESTTANESKRKNGSLKNKLQNFKYNHKKRKNPSKKTKRRSNLWSAKGGSISSVEETELSSQIHHRVFEFLSDSKSFELKVVENLEDTTMKTTASVTSSLQQGQERTPSEEDNVYEESKFAVVPEAPIEDDGEKHQRHSICPGADRIDAGIINSAVKRNWHHTINDGIDIGGDDVGTDDVGAYSSLASGEDEDCHHEDEEINTIVDDFRGLVRRTIRKSITKEASSCRRRIHGILQTMDPRLGLNENGICLFQIAGSCTDDDGPWIVVEVPACGRTVFVYSVVRFLGDDGGVGCEEADCGGDDDVVTRASPLDSLFRYALELNYMKQATRGGCLSLDDGGKELTLTYTHPVCAMDQREFENILGNFYETLLDIDAKLEAKFPRMRGAARGRRSEEMD